jgi:hydroxymethylglutaryl-CoA lyase
MSNAVKIIECPRDAWQGLPAQIPSDVKANYLRSLADAGFTHIDAASFVSSAAIPQMADSERVLELLHPPASVEIIGIVVNEKGADRAIQTGAVTTLGFPYSISPQFLRRNQHQTPAESLEVFKAIVASARAGGLNVVAYISMAFGNPYGDPWSTHAIVDACRQLSEAGAHEISLADTVGLAAPEQIRDTVATAIGAHPALEIGVHLHARRGEATAGIRAAYEAGCRRFDAAIGGLGGCPFAQDDLVGNIPTETLIAVLADCGATLPSLGNIEILTAANSEIARQFGTLTQQ